MAASKKSAVCGAKTEVYSRVCGYHRPTRNWNKGKQAEFQDRQEYSAASAERPEVSEKVA